jgi:hypothetical protein
LNLSSGSCRIGKVCFSKIKKPSIKRSLRAETFFPFLNKRIFTHSKNQP